MGLFLVEMEVEYEGKEYREFLKLCLEECEHAKERKEAGATKHFFKKVGERKFYMVMDLPAEDIDTAMFTHPMMKQNGDKVRVNITPLIPYETFASFVDKTLGKEDHEKPVTAPVERAGIFYWLKFDVEYPGKSQEDLFNVWSKEAAAAIGAKSKGIVVDLWKSVARRQVHALLCVDSPDMLDDISLSLPIMQMMGDTVHIECSSLRTHDSILKCFKGKLDG